MRVSSWLIWFVAAVAACDGTGPTETGDSGTTCVHQCDAVDDRSCDGADVVRCTEDGDGCRVWTVEETCTQPALCLDAEGPPACDGDVYARFTLPGNLAQAYELLVRPFIDPATAPRTDLPEAEWATADGTAWLLLQLPREVKAGQTYTLSNPDTLATLFWSSTVYTPHRKEAVLSVTVDRWPGLRGAAEGTVSATLHSPLGGEITVSDGTWRAPIVAWPEK